MGAVDLNEHLEPLGFLVGKTWRGEFSESRPEKPLADVMRWERALNGNAIRVTHSVNEGEYGGETVIVWNPESGQLVYYYFTTSGFYTHGSIEAEGSHYTAHETVTGNSSGITAVKSHTHLTDDGHVRVSSQYFRDGTWVEGHQITYAESPDARVVFR